MDSIDSCCCFVLEKHKHTYTHILTHTQSLNTHSTHSTHSTHTQHTLNTLNTHSTHSTHTTHTDTVDHQPAPLHVLSPSQHLLLFVSHVPCIQCDHQAAAAHQPFPQLCDPHHPGVIGIGVCVMGEGCGGVSMGVGVLWWVYKQWYVPMGVGVLRWVWRTM